MPRSCSSDGGRPPATVVKEEVANRLKLLCSRGMVVSVKEKAGTTCQVWTKETNESEPPMTCRNYEMMSKRVLELKRTEKHEESLVIARAASGREEA